MSGGRYIPIIVKAVILCRRIVLFVFSTSHVMMCTASVSFDQSTRHNSVSGPKFVTRERFDRGGGVNPSKTSVWSFLRVCHCQTPRRCFGTRGYIWIIRKMVACHEGDLEIVACSHLAVVHHGEKSAGYRYTMLMSFAAFFERAIQRMIDIILRRALLGNLGLGQPVVIFR